MIVSDTAVKKRISVMVLALIIVIAGVFSYVSLPRENSPDITIPNVFVQHRITAGCFVSRYRNRHHHPDRKKTQRDWSGSKRSTPSAPRGLSQINIEFIPGTDIDLTSCRRSRTRWTKPKAELPTDLEDDPAVL
jgi:multidrug efflux pump